MNESQHDAKPLRLYFAVLSRRKWALIVPVVAAAVAAASFVLARPHTYASSSELLFGDSGEQQAPVDVSLQSRVVTSPAVLNEVTARTGIPVETLAVHAEQNGTLPILRVTATAGGPERAQQTAEAVVDAYLESQRQRAGAAQAEIEAALQTRIDQVNAELEEVEEQLGALERRRRPDEGEVARLSSSRDALLGQLAVLRSELDEAALQPAGPAIPEILTPASFPETPAGPGPLQATAVGALFGLLAGFAVVLAREQFDERARAALEIEQTLGVPVLASIPRLPGKRQANKLVMHHDRLSVSAESFRMLREALVSNGVGKEKRILVVISALKGEGKTTVVANLAAAFAEKGLTTLAVDGDLRQPNLHRLLSTENDRGLSELLCGLPAQAELVGEDGSRLSLLSAGQQRKAPQSLLTSSALGKFLSGLERADVVVVDTPPLLSVADSAELLRHADAVLIITNPRLSDRPVLAGLRAALRGLPGELVGVAVNDTAEFFEQPYYGYPEGRYAVVHENEPAAP